MAWDRELFRADVLAESKERVMPSEIIDCRLNTLVDLYLFNPRIALDIENSVTRQQVVIEFLCAANIQNRIGRFIKLTDIPQR